MDFKALSTVQGHRTTKEGRGRGEEKEEEEKEEKKKKHLLLLPLICPPPPHQHNKLYDLPNCLQCHVSINVME